ncbi:MAG: calcium/proton exchanger Cax [Solirubrobacterales bacterium]|nr:calcium/proton exchanger Cax [Solirubrobacterales bacterium]
MPRLYYLGGFVPAAVILDLLGVSASLVFVSSALGVIPAAALMSDATEQLAEHSGPSVAGLLNVTFGNAPELIIAVFALADGLQEVVKASLVGSVIGNALLVLGAAMLAGGRRHPVQRFGVGAARVQAITLVAGVGALVVPSVVRLAQGSPLPAVDDPRQSFGSDLETLSIVVAFVLILAYVASLLASLRGGRGGPSAEQDREQPRWSRRKALAVLGAASLLVAVASDTLVGSVEHASSQIGLSQFFIGLIVVAIVGNAAEHWVAVVAAVRDKMDLTISIAVGSAAQVGMFLAPVVVLLSFLIGPAPMAMVFNGYELVALALAALLAAALTARGRSTARSGVALLTLYSALAILSALA